jgi:hypothetical protein
MCVYRILLVKHEEKRPLGGHWRVLKDTIKIDFQEKRWGMDWIDLALDRHNWRLLCKGNPTSGSIKRVQFIE